MFSFLFSLVSFVSFILDAMETLPRFDDLDFYTGTIKYVGVAEGRQNRRHIPMVLSIGVNEKRFKLPASIGYKQLKPFQGNQATIGTWTRRRGPFFIKETETWHLVIDGKNVYEYKARFDRSTRIKPYALAALLLCAALCVSSAIIILLKAFSAPLKNMEIK